ncbi:TerB family tellurite resistance protein [Microbulbifer rhizosphaerae]|uniref:Putative tellurite resistance protein B-like protein n=1 Tax=Microbulbifer rhizosphaerae TaxID=1562603 RepID=A0A7W4WC15_9GAMM|nr:TerB family tellurite resistance protein [Microbulbifer rhizosphaerae]MBB3061504.1 putative tellurite resistance protein B-like protein [Microbulbifer rhizosphaerae]
MHILIGLITAIGGLVWALYRLQNAGVDLNSFNPFYWLRRRNWQKQLGTKPLHRLDRPMDAAAVLLVAIAKAEGEISREQKAQITDIFSSEFNLTEPQAAELFASSAYMLREVLDVEAEIKHILEPTKAAFTSDQRESLLQMLARVAELEGNIGQAQQQIISAVSRELGQRPETTKKWQ